MPGVEVGPTADGLDPEEAAEATPPHRTLRLAVWRAGRARGLGGAGPGPWRAAPVHEAAAAAAPPAPGREEDGCQEEDV